MTRVGCTAMGFGFVRTWFVLASTLLAWAAPGATRAALPFVGVNAGAPISGENILFTDAVAADIASSGCSLVRINFISGASGWDATRLGKYDTIIGNATNNGLQVLAIFSNETLTGYSQAQWNENYNTTGMNAFIGDYAATAFLLIDRYKADVKHYELWNEPSCWSQDPNSHPLDAGCSYIWPRIFANLTAETYKECIALGGSAFFGSNGVSLVSGGLFAHDIGGSGPASATSYAHNTYTQTDIWDAFEVHANNPTGRRYPWDYFGYHFYLNQGSAVSISELNSYFNGNSSGHLNDGIHTEMLSHADPAAILLSEFGWTTEGVGEQGKADNLTDAYEWMGTQSFIAAAIWYQYNCCDPNGDWGLTQGIGNYEPAWYAFAAQCGQVAPPVADFGAAPVSGLAPLDVQFTDLSIGLVDTYLWDFGDASTSGQANPSHQYTVPGTYTVSLTVTGPGGVDAETKVDYVTVAPQANPADLDGDGDADLTDFARFAGCYTGPGQTTPPPGCDTGTGTPSPAIHNYELAASLGALSDSITAGDLIDGVIGTQEAGGFHQAVPGGVPGGLADLTDGAVGSSLEAVLADYSRPALQVRYDFSPPRDIDHLHVFVANNDGRVFQDYDVSYSTDGDPLFQTLSDGVTTGPFGQVNAGAHGASLTRLVSSASGPIAVEVDALCFVFYDVSTVSPPNVFWDAYDAGEGGDTDGQPRAYVGSIVKEIDVFEYTGPPLPTNLADLDGDGDVNLTDLDAFDACLTGPGDDPGTPPPLPPGCV